MIEPYGGMRKMVRKIPEAKTTTATKSDKGKKMGKKSTRIGRVVSVKKGAKSKTGMEKKKGWTGSDSSQFGITKFFPIREKTCLDEWSHGIGS